MGSLPGLDAAPNIHPVFIHFPIALWFAALGFWLAALLFGKERLWQVGRWLLNLGLVGAVFAVGTGLWAEAQLGHDSPGHELVHAHRNLMLAASGMALLTSFAAQVWRKATSPIARVALTALMIGAVAVTTFGADRGALVSIRHAGHDHPATEDHDHAAHEHADKMHPHADDTAIEKKDGSEAEPHEHVHADESTKETQDSDRAAAKKEDSEEKPHAHASEDDPAATHSHAGHSHDAPVERTLDDELELDYKLDDDLSYD